MTVIIGQLAIAILVLFSYPLQCHPCRASVDKIITRGVNRGTEISQTKFMIMTVAILISSYCLAVTVKSLSMVKKRSAKIFSILASTNIIIIEKLAEIKMDSHFSSFRYYHWSEQQEAPPYVTFYLVFFIIKYEKNIMK